MSPLLVQQVAQGWLKGDEFERPESEIDLVGWGAGEDEEGEQTLHYRSTGHSDPVIKAWIEFVMHKASAKGDEDSAELAEGALEYLLDASEGAGACGKCHAAGLQPDVDVDESLTGLWGYRGANDSSHTKYAHSPHLNLLGPDTSCDNCHKMNAKADYPGYFENSERTGKDYQSNFLSIERDTCVECHRDEKARYDCQLCHTYHKSPGFKTGFQKLESKQ